MQVKQKIITILMIILLIGVAQIFLGNKALAVNSTEQNMQIKLTSNITENSSVPEGQIVKFFVQVTNSGENKQQNATVNIPVPEGTSYTQYHSSNQTYIDSQETNIKLSLGDIEPGKTAKTNYELKIQQGTLGKVENVVKVTAKNLKQELNSNTYILNVIEGKLDLTLTIPREPNTTLNKGDILYSTLVLDAKQTLKDVIININIPEGIKIKQAIYQKGTEQKNINIQTNQVTYTISTIDPQYLQCIKLTLEIDSFTGEFIHEATITSQEIEKQVSNQLVYTVGTPNFNITQKNIEKQTIKETEQITYEFTIENIGNSHANEAVFENKLPQGLKFIKMQYTYQGKTQEITSTLNNTAQIRWTKFEKGTTATVKIVAQADLLSNDKQDKTLTNIGTIYAQGIQKTQSNSTTTTVKYNSQLYEGNAGNESQTKNKTTKKTNNTNTQIVGTSNKTTTEITGTEKFDFKLNKYINKITLTTPTIGTKVYNFNNSNLEKIEILKQNINKSSIIIEYKIVVTNEGELSGYVKKIADYLPENVKFSSELNKDWYISNETNTLYNTSLANTIIKPGESKQITLILSTEITDNNIGTILTNQAEIYEIYNEQGKQDIDSIQANNNNQEDDLAKAEIVLSIVTGNVAIYIILTLIILTLLVIGIIATKKVVLTQIL